MSVNVTVTFSEEILQQIDKRRGLVNRSRFICSLIESVFAKQKEEGGVAG